MCKSSLIFTIEDPFRIVHGNIKREGNMRYICANCGYTYEPDQGDPMNDIPPGTAFADLPDNWVCPLCYATMDSFDPLD